MTAAEARVGCTTRIMAMRGTDARIVVTPPR
jgi:hypothetical protein